MAKPVLIIRIPQDNEKFGIEVRHTIAERLKDYHLLFVKEDIERVELEIIDSENRQSTFKENIKK
jgi:hypothetical protein